MPDNKDTFHEKAPPDRGASSFIYPATAANIRFFADALRAGCLVAIPTETVYGLAGLALDPDACASIFRIKGRPLIDPLIVHAHDIATIKGLAEWTEPADRLAAAFWPGPLTLVLPKKPSVPAIVTAGRETVAVRMPRHPVARRLLAELAAPLAAPSANPFGYVSPSRACHVADSFGDRVPFILDGGDAEIGLESTIVNLANSSRPEVLRPGAISAESLAAVLQVPVPYRKGAENGGKGPEAPGMLEQHYSPRTPVRLFNEGSTPASTDREAVVYLARPPENLRPPGSYWLSQTGDPNEIARNLFSLLRQLDSLGCTGIACELPESKRQGLYIAIRDRLERAAAKNKAGGS